MRLDYIDNKDCIEGMREIPSGSVDLVVADPPYMFSQASAAGRKIDPWADWTNAAFWYAEWFKEARRILKDSGAMWVFLNWRSLVTFQKAACMVDWPIESVLVWDKKWIGPGGVRGLRPSYELCALFCKPDFAIPNRGLADIQAFKWSSHKPHGHPAEKPEALIRWLIEQSTSEDAIVCDPFMGSGTTAEACIKTGRRFVGFELSEQYHRMATERVADALLA